MTTQELLQNQIDELQKQLNAMKPASAVDATPKQPSLSQLMGNGDVCCPVCFHSLYGNELIETKLAVNPKDGGSYRVCKGCNFTKE